MPDRRMSEPSLPKLSTKDQLAGRLHRHPWLEQLALVLLYDWRFRIALIALFLLIAGVFGLLYRGWRVTPPELDPPVKISVLDYFQARSLQRTAIEDLRAGRFDAGLRSWQLAVSNNPGDLDIVRGYLRDLASFGDPKRHLRSVLTYGPWLLRLTSTNLVEAELVAKVYHRFRLDEWVVNLLQPFETNLTPNLDATYAKALLATGQPGRFAERLGRLTSQGILASDPELPLYRAAYLAGWTDGASAEQGQAELDQAKADTRFSVLAHRLQLLVAEQRRDLRQLAASLEVLQNQREITTSDHLAYLALLTQSGQKQTAIDYLRANALNPHSPNEVVRLARQHFDLGLGDEAREILRQYLKDYPGSEALVLSLANLLADQQQWGDLYELALRLRADNNPARNEMLGFSYYLEGLAESKRGHPSLATEAFRNIRKAIVEGNLLWARIAEGLQQAGQSEQAQEILLAMRAAGEKNPEYWSLLARTAHDLKDANLLTFAMAAAHKLRPDDPAVLQDYAAALLSARLLPAEAVRLTFQLYTRYPDHTAAKINHAAALAQNQRLQESRAILETIDLQRLPEAELNVALLVWFEICFREARYDQALALEKRIQRRPLFPPEARWLDESVAAIHERLATHQSP